MSEFWFRWEDFKGMCDLDCGNDVHDDMCAQSYAMRYANTRLEAEREKALVVYTPDMHHLVNRKVDNVHVRWGTLKSPLSTHRARLFDIQEIDETEK